MTEKEKILEDLQYLFSKINWKDSILDGKAIEIMNELPRRIDRLKIVSDYFYKGVIGYIQFRKIEKGTEDET